jgi:hypothetical protein
VVVGPAARRLGDFGDAVATARALVASGESVSAAAREAATGSGHPRREIYEALLKSQERS